MPRLNFAQPLGLVHCGQGLDFDVWALFLGLEWTRVVMAPCQGLHDILLQNWSPLNRLQ